MITRIALESTKDYVLQSVILTTILLHVADQPTVL